MKNRNKNDSTSFQEADKEYQISSDLNFSEKISKRVNTLDPSLDNSSAHAKKVPVENQS
jgi:hypothetical protein